MKPLQTVAFIISAIFHPLLLPTLVSLTVFYVVPVPSIWIPEKAKLPLASIIFVMTFIAPTIGVLFYYFAGTVKSLHMDNRRDRFYPFVFTTCLYAIVTYLFATSNVEIFLLAHVFTWFLGGITLTLLIVSVITFYWKVSAHSAGIAGVLAFWVAVAFRYQESHFVLPVVVTILLVGVLLACRLYLNAHTLAQIGVGFLVGFLVNFGAILMAIA